MKLLTAILIFFDQHPDVHLRMKDAVQKLKQEERLQERSILCQETLKAMQKMRRKK